MGARNAWPLFTYCYAEKQTKQWHSAERKGTALLSRHQREKVHCPEHCRTALKSGFQEVLNAAGRKILFSIYQVSLTKQVINHFLILSHLSTSKTIPLMHCKQLYLPEHLSSTEPYPSSCVSGNRRGSWRSHVIWTQSLKSESYIHSPTSTPYCLETSEWILWRSVRYSCSSLKKLKFTLEEGKEGGVEDPPFFHSLLNTSAPSRNFRTSTQSTKVKHFFRHLLLP